MPDWMKDPFHSFMNTFLTKKVAFNYMDDKVAPAKQNIDPQRTAMAIKYNETRGEKNPYDFSRFSGSKSLGNALGAYQVTEGELKTYAPKFLGRSVTSEEYQKDPSLQDMYTQAKVSYLRDKGLNLSQILAAHRGGFSNLNKINDTMSQYKGYVDAGVTAYNQQPWNTK